MKKVLFALVSIILITLLWVGTVLASFPSERSDKSRIPISTIQYIQINVTKNFMDKNKSAIIDAQGNVIPTFPPFTPDAETERMYCMGMICPTPIP